MDLLPLMLVPVGALPHGKGMQTIDLLGKHVLPKLRKGAAAESAAAGR